MPGASPREEPQGPGDEEEYPPAQVLSPLAARRQLVESRQASHTVSETQVDEDTFVLWPGGARLRTPNTRWRPAGASAPSHPKVGHRWSSTLRSVLEGGHARPKAEPTPPGTPETDDVQYSAHAQPSPCSSPTASIASCVLDGDWFARSDGELQGRIQGGKLFWEEDGTATTLYMHSKRGDVVSMVVDGDTHCGVLSEDGRLLKWNDGDIWVRVLPESIIDQSLWDYGHSSNEVEQEVWWEDWTNTKLNSHNRHTSKSVASAAYTAYSSQCFQEYGESPEELRPSAAFM